MSATHTANAQRVLDTAHKQGAEYADVQFWSETSERMFVRNGVVRGVARQVSVGYAVRALVDGSWGFAGSDRFEDAGFDGAAALAVALAKSSVRVPNRIRAVTPSEKYVDEYRTPVEIDPATVSLSQRADDLIAAEKALHVDKSVVAGFSFMTVWTTDKEFFSTNGSAIVQRISQAGAGCGATAVGAD